MSTVWGVNFPVEIKFGVGARAELSNSFSDKSCLIVCSKRGRLQIEQDKLLSKFLKQNSIHWLDSVAENPDIEDLQACVEEVKGVNFDLVVGFGGGSSLDASKVMALAILPEMRGHKLEKLIASPQLHSNITRVPLCALPTTSGTGSEVTPFATVWDKRKCKKMSLASANSFPSMALIDPELTVSLPRSPTINTGLDAINQAMESIWNVNANPITMSWAFRAIKTGLGALPALLDAPLDFELRTRMAECSVLAGMAISQTKTALCHSISYPLTAHFGVPHGLACAFTMPAVLELNLASNDHRFDDLAKYLNTPNLLSLFHELNRVLNVRESVMSYISDPDLVMGLLPEMYTPERAKNNMIPVDQKDIETILNRALAR